MYCYYILIKHNWKYDSLVKYIIIIILKSNIKLRFHQRVTIM